MIRHKSHQLPCRGKPWQTVANSGNPEAITDTEIAIYPCNSGDSSGPFPRRVSLTACSHASGTQETCSSRVSWAPRTILMRLLPVTALKKPSDITLRVTASPSGRTDPLISNDMPSGSGLPLLHGPNWKTVSTNHPLAWSIKWLVDPLKSASGPKLILP